MARAGIRIEGARELRRALKQAGDDLGDLKDLHREVGQVVATEGQELVPVLSGALRGTIRPTAGATAATVKAGTGRVVYAGPIHFGWPGHNIEPQPFLFDALDRRRDEVQRKYETAIDQITDRI